MTGIDDGGGRKGEKTVKGIDELMNIPSGKVGSTIAHTKKCVSGNECIRFEKQTYATGRMSGRMEDTERQVRSFRKRKGLRT